MNRFKTQIDQNKSGLTRGLEKASDIVCSTMGASGKNVIIANSFGELKTTKDGVSVAKAMQFADPFENIGAKLIISAANKTVEQVGDGTTATALLLRRLYDSRDAIPKDRLNSVLAEMDEAINLVVKEIKRNSKQIKDNDDIHRIAAISSNSQDLGDLFKEIYEDVGTDSLISLEISQNENETYYDVTKGHVFHAGYLSASFANQPNGHCTFENPIIYVDNSRWTDIDKYADIMSEANKARKPIVMISPAFSQEFVMMARANRSSNNLAVCLIKAPGYGHGMIEDMKDVLSLLKEDGTVDKITITPTQFTIISENPVNLDNRLKELKEMIKSASDTYEQDKSVQRLHNLKNTMAIIYAGGNTPEAAKEEYDRIDDALGAVKAALEEGYVSGGGVALLNAGQTVKFDDTKIGHKIVKTLCREPIKTILSNAQLTEIDRLLTKLEKPGQGFNVAFLKTDEPQPIDMLEEGIIDPTKVIVNSLVNAFATFTLILKSDYSLYNEMN